MIDSSKPQLSDHALIEGVESATLPAGSFGHREHVRLAWLYLRRKPLLGALASVSRAIRGFAEHHGAPDKYHATITWAYGLVIFERLRDAPPGESFDAFVARNPDLLQHEPSVLDAWYSPEILAGESARGHLAVPDRVG